MTWLFPLYLLGGAAIIGPILMHLRRRPPQDRVEFSSLMFLDAQTPMPVSKRRLENWLLLLLRCLALICLALMFARPIWRSEDDTISTSQSATILLLDRSASMRRGDLWQQAVTEATKRITSIKPADRLALATFDQDLQLLWSFDQDKNSASVRTAVLKPQLAQAQAGWGSTDLGKALVEAIGQFSQAQGLAGMKKKIVLITDLQEGAKLEALRTQVWPETIALDVHRVEAPNLDNMTVALASENRTELQVQADEDKAASLTKEQTAPLSRVRLTNSRDAKLSDYRLTLDGTNEAPLSGYLPPGVSRVLPIPAPAASITLTGDTWDFDNRVFIAPPQPKTVKIVFIGDEKTRSEAASPLFYLSRALQPTPSLRPELIVLPEATPTIPADTQLVFLSGARPKADLRAYLNAGGFVVSVITEKTTAAELEALTGIAAAGGSLKPSQSSSSETYAMLAEVQTAHPLLRPFADERLRDFTKLRFWHHRQVSMPQDAPLTVLARFDDGDPALLTSTQGKGTLILLTSGWHPADSQFALSTKFVPLLYGWLEAAGFRNEEAASLLVGDVLPMDQATSITMPDGKQITPQAGEVIRAEAPGIYTISQGTTKRELRAVNLAPEEGRVTPLEIGKLRELGIHLEAATATSEVAAQEDAKERLALTEQESRQRAWFWLLASLLALLAGETWLAGRIRQSAPQQAFTPA